jgi:uncharacterized protein (TIGR00369 family)
MTTTDIDKARADAIAASFARQGLMRTLDARIDRIAPVASCCRCRSPPPAGQQHGFAHAGATFALGDSAAGYAALSLMDPGAEVLTVEMKINLIAPASGQRLLAEGEVVKPGRRLFVVRATVRSEGEDGALRDVALMQGTMIPA